MFEAAVLPAVVVARRVAAPPAAEAAFVRVYEDEDQSNPAAEADSLLEALATGAEGRVQVHARRFVIERGRLREPTEDKPWRLTTSSGSRWRSTVHKHSAARFGDLGSVRVGIKTTADSVFIDRHLLTCRRRSGRSRSYSIHC